MNLSKSTWVNGATGAWLLVAAFGCSGNTSLGGVLDAGVGGSTQPGNGGSTGSNGGAFSTGGKRSTGGSCALLECFRAVECVEYCGGPVVSSSCCPCGDGTVDRMTACVGFGGNTSVGSSAATGGATGTVYSPCGGKKCGDTCTICAPNDTSCVETNMLKACDSSGSCVGSSLVQCGASGGAPGTGGATSTPVYQPCAGKQCGETCTLCPPNSADCFETAVVKSCNLAGQCVAGNQQCTSTSGGAPGAGGATSTPVYQPCAGKQCGETCTLCPPNSADCFETAVMKSCNSAGQCVQGTQTCSMATGGSTGAGGSTTVGGRTGTGGHTYACDLTIDCNRANPCVEYCGGPVVTSCCRCPTGTMETDYCSAATGGAPSTAPATSGTKCGAAVCGDNEECCNASCSLCVPKGNGCVAMECSTGGSTSLGGASSTGTSTSITGLHQACTDRTCSPGLTPVQYYGIAGTNGPLFCSCEIPCTDTTDNMCPNGLSCTVVHDGPGSVCY